MKGLEQLGLGRYAKAVLHKDGTIKEVMHDSNDLDQVLTLVGLTRELNDSMNLAVWDRQKDVLIFPKAYKK